MDVNVTNNTAQSPYRKFGESQALKGIRIFSFVCIFVVGVVGNLLTMIAARRRRLRTVTNLFIANLSLADFTVSLVNIPINIGQASVGHWFYGYTLCKVVPYLQGISVCASVGMLLAIATDRFFVIVYPIGHKLNTNQASMVAAFVWGVSFIVPVPVLAFNRLVTAEVDGRIMAGCFEIWPTKTAKMAYQLFLFVVLFICPMLTLCVMYAMIGQALNSAEWLQKVTRQVHRRIVRMLVAVVLLFAVCWFPFHVMFLYLETRAFKETDSLVSLILFVQWLMYANSACNPVVYTILNKGFRREFWAIIRCTVLRLW